MGNTHPRVTDLANTWIYSAGGEPGVDEVKIIAPSNLLPPPELQFYRPMFGPITYYFVPNIGTEGEG